MEATRALSIEDTIYDMAGPIMPRNRGLVRVLPELRLLRVSRVGLACDELAAEAAVHPHDPARPGGAGSGRRAAR
jgi:hypothetical protein